MLFNKLFSFYFRLAKYKILIFVQKIEIRLEDQYVAYLTSYFAFSRSRSNHIVDINVIYKNVIFTVLTVEKNLYFLQLINLDLFINLYLIIYQG